MIVVLGASGNIGSATVSALKQKGAQFKAGYRKPEEMQKAQQRGYDAVQVDYGDRLSLARAFEGAQRVFFVNPPSPQMLSLETNVLNAAKQAGVKLLVKSSVWGAESEDFVFSRPHRASEKQIEASGVPYVFVQPNGFFQNLLASAPLIQSQSMFAQPDSDPAVSEVDVQDIGNVAAAILTSDGHEGKAYRVSGPVAITGAQKAQVLSELLGRAIKCVVVLREQWKQAAMKFGVSDWLAGGIIDLQRYYAEGKASAIVDTVPRFTGAPARTFQQFARGALVAFGG
jgi:uncharacterized protein YbjT (DUF2867 family)